MVWLGPVGWQAAADHPAAGLNDRREVAESGRELERHRPAVLAGHDRFLVAGGRHQVAAALDGVRDLVRAAVEVDVEHVEVILSVLQDVLENRLVISVGGAGRRTAQDDQRGWVTFSYGGGKSLQLRDVFRGRTSEKDRHRRFVVALPVRHAAGAAGHDFTYEIPKDGRVLGR